MHRIEDEQFGEEWAYQKRTQKGVEWVQGL